MFPDKQFSVCGSFLPIIALSSPYIIPQQHPENAWYILDTQIFVSSVKFAL